ESTSSLRRSLGRTTATLLTAAMIIGTGLFAALGPTAEKAGTGLLLAITISGLVALATGLSAASVGVNFPEEGGGFTWSRKFGHPTLGFIAGCAYLGKGIVSTVVIALAFAAYTARIAQGLPPYAMHIIAAVAVLAVGAVNLRGIALNARVLIVTLFIQLGLLAVFVAVSGAALGVVGAKEMSGRGTSDTPLIVAGVRAMGSWGLWVILAAAWLDTLTEAWGDLLTVTRVALAMGKERELPAWLGVV